MLDDLSHMQDANNDPMLEQLIQATQHLNRQINDAIQDDAINWGFQQFKIFLILIVFIIAT